MDTLYYSPGTCSLATQVILREIGAEFTLKNKKDVADFSTISKVGAVPVLHNGTRYLREGAAIILYLLEQHKNSLLPESGEARTQAIQNLLFANATVHPAYSKLFFLGNAAKDESQKIELMKAAAQSLDKLWTVVEDELGDKPFLGGSSVSPADILLAVYSNWGKFFPVEIHIPDTVQAMIKRVMQMPTYQASVNSEKALAA
jgi:glutathione S-transferase